MQTKNRNNIVRLQETLWSCNAVTLLELTIAMVMTALVVGIIFSSWKDLAAHVLRQAKIEALHTEVKSIGQRITQDIRRSKKILAWSIHDITLISSKNNDTISYSFTDTLLTRNDTTITLTSPNSWVSDVSFKDTSEKISSPDTPFRNINFMLFSITITLADHTGNHVEYTQIIAAPRQQTPSSPVESDRWNMSWP